MPKEEWGVKRVCPKCSVRFYDLQKDPMTCPACGASFDVASLTQQKTRSVAPERAKPETAPAEDNDLDTDVEVIDDEDDAAAADDLDDDILDDDDDDDTVTLEEIADVPSETEDS